MSVIACRVDDKGVSIAVDSRVSYGDLGVTRGTSIADQKLWLTPDGLVIAFCGDSSLGTVLRRWTREKSPVSATEVGMTAYVDDFNRWRAEHYTEAGEITNLSFMAVYQGRAWVVDQYSVSEIPPGGYMAHGSGLPVAIGALYCGAHVVEAVSAAATHQDGCGFPVVWATIPRDGEITGNIERMEAEPAQEREVTA